MTIAARLNINAIEAVISALDLISDEARQISGTADIYGAGRFHYHKCPGCGSTWGHSGNKADRASHRCQQCGCYQFVSTQSGLHPVIDSLYNILACKKNLFYIVEFNDSFNETIRLETERVIKHDKD